MFLGARPPAPSCHEGASKAKSEGIAYGPGSSVDASTCRRCKCLGRAEQPPQDWAREASPLVRRDRALALGGRSGRSTFRFRARAAIREAPTRFGPERRSIHDWWARRLATAQISLKRMRRFRLAPRGGQNGARPGYRAILHGEYALCALEGLFGFPCRSVRIGGHASAQGVHPSAVETLGVHNGQLPSRWSLLTTPSPNPMGRDQSVCAPRALGESGWAP